MSAHSNMIALKRLSLFIVLLVFAFSSSEVFTIHNRNRSCISHKKHDTVFSFKNHAKCIRNESYCGDWSERQWNPLNCKYRDITVTQGRKCMKNRTIACIGDSQIRDLCNGLAYFLLGATVEDSPNNKFDKHDLLYRGNATMMHDFNKWKGYNKDTYTGFIYPKEEIRLAKGYDFQVQIWELYANFLLRHDKAGHILNNEMRAELPILNKIDLAFWSHGLHDWGYWDSMSYGEKYYKSMVQQWMGIREKVEVPSVWVSMNNECEKKIKPTVGGVVLQAERIPVQVAMVEHANVYIKERLHKEGLPYFDAASVLRSPQRCAVSADGVHVAMWVDIVRAKILLNHLCDEDYNWVGNIANFF